MSHTRFEVNGARPNKEGWSVMLVVNLEEAWNVTIQPTKTRYLRCIEGGFCTKLQFVRSPEVASHRFTR